MKYLFQVITILVFTGLMPTIAQEDSSRWGIALVYERLPLDGRIVYGNIDDPSSNYFEDVRLPIEVSTPSNRQPRYELRLIPLLEVVQHCPYEDSSNITFGWITRYSTMITIRLTDLETGHEISSFNTRFANHPRGCPAKASFNFKDEVINYVGSAYLQYDTIKWLYELIPELELPGVIRSDNEVIKGITPSSNAQKILVQGDNKTEVWDITSGEMVSEIDNGTTFDTFSFNADSSEILGAQIDGSVFFWQTETGDLLDKISHSVDYCSLQSISYAPDGRLSAIVEDQCDTSWADGHELHLISVAEGTSQPLPVWRPDGTEVAVVADGFLSTAAVEEGWYVVHLFDAQTGEERLRSDCGHPDRITSIEYNFDGSKLITTGETSPPHICDAETGRVLLELTDVPTPTKMAVFSPDGKTILTMSEDASANLWDSSTGKEIWHRGSLNGTKYSPDGSQLIAWGNGVFITINATTGEETLLPTKSPRAASYSPDNKLIVSAAFDEVKVLAVDSGLKTILTIEEEHVDDISFSPDGTSLITVNWDDIIRLWDIGTGELKFELAPDPRTEFPLLKKFSFSPDGNLITAQYLAAPVMVWNAQTGEQIGRFSIDNCYFVDSNFTKDSRLLIITAAPDLCSPVLQGNIDAKQLVVNAYPVAFDPDAKTIAGSYTVYNDLTNVESDSKVITIYASENGQVLQQFSAEADYLIAMGYHPDGKRFFTVGASNSPLIMSVWDATTGERLYKLPIEMLRDGIPTVSFSPDGAHILTLNRDYQLQFWDADNGEAIGTLETRDETSQSSWRVVAYTPDGRLIVSGNNQGLIRIWKTEELLEIAQNGFRPYFTSVGSSNTASVTPTLVISSSSTCEGTVASASPNINVRSGPGTNNPVIQTVPRGLEVQVIEIQSGWYHITFDNVDGWVLGDLVTLNDSNCVFGS